MQLYCNTIVTETGLRAEKDGVAIQKLYCEEQWQRQGAGLGIRRSQGRWGAGRACWGAGACSGRWGVRQGARADALAWQGQEHYRQTDARGARHERQARGCESDDRAMLAYDTAEGPAATRPRLLRHGASVLSAHGHARPGLSLGAGWVGWLGQLGQVGALCTWLNSDSVFGPGSTPYFPESLNEHCSL